MTTIPKFEVVAAVIIQDGKVLMCRSRGNELYYCPGGKLEKGETEKEAIIRECKEEISIEIIPESIKKIFRFEAEAYGFSEPKIVVMNCYSFEFNGQITPSAEVEELFWAGEEDLDRLAPAARDLIDRLKKDNLLV